MRAGSTACAVALCAVVAAAQAQHYPAKPVRVIMTVGAGADLMARLIGQRVGEALGQPLVTEIQSAAGGSVGAQMVARAAPDGYTLLLSSASSQITRAFLAANTPYDPAKDFTPIAGVADTIIAVAAHPSFAPRDMKELVDAALRSPGKIPYASSGVGTTGHLSFELLKMVTGAELLHVPYKSGSQSVGDLLGGQIPLSAISLSPLIAHVKSAKLKLLAVNTAQRFRMLREVPTLSEQVQGYESPPAWSGYLGPAGLPAPITRRLNEEINKAMAMPEVRDKLEAIGFVVLPANTSEEFAASIRRDRAHVGRIVKAAGIKAE